MRTLAFLAESIQDHRGFAEGIIFFLSFKGNLGLHCPKAIAHISFHIRKMMFPNLLPDSKLPKNIRNRLAEKKKSYISVRLQEKCSEHVPTKGNKRTLLNDDYSPTIVNG